VVARKQVDEIEPCSLLIWRENEHRLFSYAVDGIDEWIVATVTHRQPMTRKENDIDVAVPRINEKR
jgi:hypothetical protein